MNEQELNMSKLSYVNRDFASIYPDLLDLVKEITKRWDPSASNESDPGVVLLKAAAFVADHLNYNIDKNVLECFLPSATQEESVRRIAEFGGYTPKYYRSAIGKVSVNYNPENFNGALSIPPFSLIVSNSDNSIVYTQIGTIDIAQKNVPYAADFIEGTIQRLLVDSDVITLTNIDNNNRIYFPAKNVAENGIFIYNVSNGVRASEQWEKTNYIYTKAIGTKCYKLDYDSTKNLPYIEFPTDIANLIGDGLAIYYIQTSGSYGNVTAGELNTLANMDRSVSVVTDLNIEDFTVSNAKSIINGCEPESIDDIYTNYKRVVGTFDTLVSLQDYSNAVKTSTDSKGEPLVSNGLVTDRRTDYNNAVNVVTRKPTGIGYTNIGLNKFGKFIFINRQEASPSEMTTEYMWTNLSDYFPDGSIIPAGVVYTYLTDEDAIAPSTNRNCGTTYINTRSANGLAGPNKDPDWVEMDTLTKTELDSYLGGMSPYDLIIYALQKYSEADYSPIYYWQALENSFKQIDGPQANADIHDTLVINNVNCTEYKLVDELNKNKCLSHKFKSLNNGQVYCFKNYVPLKIDIVPYAKVTKYERNEILNNIRKAISDNFNASKVEFGEELNYDTMKKIIETSDNRINYVNLSDFDYYTRVMVKDLRSPWTADEYTLDTEYDDSTFYADLSAKNVVSGRLCLFEFDNNFKYEFCQVNCKPFINIVGIQTELQLEGDIQTEWVPSEGWFNSENWVPPVIDPDSGAIIVPGHWGSEGYNYSEYGAHEEPTGKWEFGTEDNPMTLGENEYLELFYPSYYSDVTYGSYVLYKFSSTSDEERTIPAGTEYHLANDETLDIYYKAEDGSIITKKYTGINDTIIQTSFDLTDFDHNGKQVYQKNTNFYNQLGSNETISTRILLETVFDTNHFVYWIVNNNAGALFKAGESERILGEGEYFIYTDSAKENLTILGRGTKLVRSGDTSRALVITAANINKVSRSQLTESGLAAKIPFELINFYNNPLTITEMNTVILGEGDKFAFIADAVEGDLSYGYINYKLKPVNNIHYWLKSDDVEVILPAQENFYEGRARLDINVSKDYPMVIGNDHLITINYGDNETYTFNGPEGANGKFIQSNVDLSLIGNVSNDSIDISIYSDFGIPINWLSYNYVPITTEDFLISSNPITLGTEKGVWCYNPITSNFIKYRGPEGLVFIGDSEYSRLDPYDSANKFWLPYLICNKIESNIDSNSIDIRQWSMETPHSIRIPFSPIWYTKAQSIIGNNEDSEQVVDEDNREYICEIYFSNIYNNVLNSDDSEGNVHVKFVLDVTSEGDYDYTESVAKRKYKNIPIGWYGNVKKIFRSLTPSDPEYYGINVLDNTSAYVYPKLGPSDNLRNVELWIDTGIVPDGYITVSNPKVVWGGNPDLAAPKSDVARRIDQLLNSGDDRVQFHWLNEPASDLALVTSDLNDPYSLFDRNNIANIITIPEVDLENSSMEIVKSMRNY